MRHSSSWLAEFEFWQHAGISQETDKQRHYLCTVIWPCPAQCTTGCGHQESKELYKAAVSEKVGVFILLYLCLYL